jgi:primosomal protein N''
MTNEFEPVQQLAKLIADENHIDGRIRDARAALTLVKRRVSETLAQNYVGNRESRIQMPEDLMKEEQSYERLLQALQDMKNEIAKQIRPVEEQIIQANVDHLRQSFGQESRRLSKCLEEVDDNILACRQYLQEY